MKFKVIEGNETYSKFFELKKRISLVSKESNRLVKSLGAKEYCKKQHVAFGGIGAIHFNEKPNGWRMVGEPYQKLYYPKATEKVLLKKFESLPVIQYDEINKIINFDAPQTVSRSGGLGWVSCYGLSWGKGFVLISIPEGAKYKPAKNVIEILESEYNNLLKKTIK